MNLRQLRRQAVSWSLGTRSPSLAGVIERLGFIQADPIRAPARAQDLILRQRVHGYRAGDLEAHYPSLALEEDVLYAYGFLSRPVWHWLAPRQQARLGKLETRVLAQVLRDGETHPNALVDFGDARVVNAWGGYSKATKRALEGLHARGLLRISRRENGIRIYAPATVRNASLGTAERLSRLATVLVGIFAPAPEKTIRAMVARLSRAFPDAEPRRVLPTLVETGVLTRAAIDDTAYLWPTEQALTDEDQPEVRLLAPFDPVVWDRTRFEQLWGWAYRFEAYTPIEKRVRGYYALPLLWRSDVIGWANVQLVDGELAVDLGFVGKRPRDRGFSSELDAELERLRAFLT